MKKFHTFRECGKTIGVVLLYWLFTAVVVLSILGIINLFGGAHG